MISILERFNRALFVVAAGLTVVMALVGGLIVVLRYGFDIGSIALQESVLYMHSFVLLMAAATTLQREGHVRVDIFYSRWPEHWRARVDRIGTVVLLWPLAACIGWASWEYVAAAWARQEASAEPGGLAWVYLLKSLILLFCLQMLLQGVVQLARAGRGR